MGDPHISSEKQKALDQRMARLGIGEDDLLEKFVLGSGSGGQKLNKTASCVSLRHVPTGIALKCQRSRSRAINRFMARRELCERIEEMKLGIMSKRKQAREKIRRQKRRRSRRARDRMLDKKSQHAEKKEHRRPVRGDE